MTFSASLFGLTHARMHAHTAHFRMAHSTELTCAQRLVAYGVAPLIYTYSHTCCMQAITSECAATIDTPPCVYTIDRGAAAGRHAPVSEATATATTAHLQHTRVRSPCTQTRTYACTYLRCMHISMHIRTDTHAHTESSMHGLPDDSDDGEHLFLAGVGPLHRSPRSRQTALPSVTSRQTALPSVTSRQTASPSPTFNSTHPPSPPLNLTHVPSPIP